MYATAFVLSYYSYITSQPFKLKQLRRLIKHTIQQNVYSSGALDLLKQIINNLGGDVQRQLLTNLTRELTTFNQ